MLIVFYLVSSSRHPLLISLWAEPIHYGDFSLSAPNNFLNELINLLLLFPVIIVVSLPVVSETLAHHIVTVNLAIFIINEYTAAGFTPCELGLTTRIVCCSGIHETKRTNVYRFSSSLIAISLSPFYRSYYLRHTYFT